MQRESRLRRTNAPKGAVAKVGPRERAGNSIGRVCRCGAEGEGGFEAGFEGVFWVVTDLPSRRETPPVHDHRCGTSEPGIRGDRPSASRHGGVLDAKSERKRVEPAEYTAILRRLERVLKLELGTFACGFLATIFLLLEETGRFLCSIMSKRISGGGYG